ncbi:MAG: endolytic transglycosylase MltG [Patescibacteria group bacterium]|nr:endolytic transglycosylase MltG [Patescibacteria group bacterium]
MRLIKSTIILIIILLVSGGTFYWRGINSVADKNGQDVQFLISSGESVKQIGKNLTEAKLVKSEFYFKAYVWKNELEAKFQAGEYVLNPSFSIKKIVKILTGGEAQSKERTIKIIEGWNIREISQYFEKEGMFQSEELLELVGFPQVDYRTNKEMPNPKNYASQFDFLADKPAYYGLEGYLFPDTYRIFKDATLDDIVLKMLDNFDKKLTPEMRAEIARQGKTIYEIITMASLVEKEVRAEDDMKIVSGIFWDRIKNKQALESCATLAYVLAVNKPQYTAEDTKIDSPYNTYQNRGLPPGPISNPGLKAIKAAIYPTYTDYNYFLSRPDTGETVFAKTYEEHVRNKAKYLK